ncbi:MAG: NIPSNAP family protein, partial [Planctomycetia bacterium]|nr:NIPSNAP family protein [Planctomycetia bacterium]
MHVRLIGAALLVGGLAAAGIAAQADKGDKKVETRVFEMRTYYAAPGKMKALHDRFRHHTVKLFEKHGMTLIGFWSPIDGKLADEKMVYILAYPSKEAADKSWKAFRDDPAWIKAKSES